ncbi:hypothetical protein, partial [Leclercia adecarboxylata]
MAYQLNLNWSEFLEKYWQKKPVVLKNALVDSIGQRNSYVKTWGCGGFL